jgi:hypothetical protein
VQDGAFKLQGGTGHDTITDLYDHPDFPDGEGHTYLDLAKAAGMVTVLELAPVVAGSHWQPGRAASNQPDGGHCGQQACAPAA